LTPSACKTVVSREKGARPVSVQDAFGSDDNEVVLFDDAGEHPLPKMGKLALARALVREIAQRLAKR